MLDFIDIVVLNATFITIGVFTADSFYIWKIKSNREKKPLIQMVASGK